MTAEITVMNKMAIAMAADSAMTITPARGEKKIYNTVNKLFALSKHHPVGIMVYDNAEIMGVPWETVIKTYRKSLGKTGFDTMEEYGNHFVEFFEKENICFHPSQQEEYFRRMVGLSLYLIRYAIKDKLNTLVKDRGEVSENEIADATALVIKTRYDSLMKTDRLANFPDSFSAQLLTKYSGVIGDLIAEILEKLPLTTEAHDQLRQISVEMFSRDEFAHSLSGVVIAGFGEKEIFPSTRSYTFEGIIENKLKHRLDRHKAVSHDVDAYVIPFAQTDMVYSFIQGVDPKYNDFTVRAVSFLHHRFCETILDKAEGINVEMKAKLDELLSTTRADLGRTFSQMLNKHRQENYTDGVMNAVGLLPKDELAAMAESLVNLTVFKHKVSMSAETVGGAVDVAVITKGDGFIWIKRKHYFKPELNPQFASSYLHLGEHYQKGE